MNLAHSPIILDTGVTGHFLSAPKPLPNLNQIPVPSRSNCQTTPPSNPRTRHSSQLTTCPKPLEQRMFFCNFATPSFQLGNYVIMAAQPNSITRKRLSNTKTTLCCATTKRQMDFGQSPPRSKAHNRPTLPQASDIEFATILHSFTQRVLAQSSRPGSMPFDIII